MVKHDETVPSVSMPGGRMRFGARGEASREVLCCIQARRPSGALDNQPLGRWLAAHHHHHHIPHHHRHHPHHYHHSAQQQQHQHQHENGIRPSHCLYNINVRLQSLCSQGRLDIALDALSSMDIALSIATYLSLLKACSKSKNLAYTKRVYAHLAVHNCELTGLLGDYLVVTLAKCGAVEDARQISHTFPHLTIFSWTAMISAYAECGRGQEALKLHQCMLEEGVQPNNYTFVSLFRACGSILDLEQGKKLHADAHANGFTSDVFVGTSLVSMYGKCGAVVEAECVFHALSQRDIVSWNAMLSTYVEHGQEKKALRLYRQMKEECVVSGYTALLIVVHACCTLAKKGEVLVVEEPSNKMIALDIGHALHADERKQGFSSNVFVGNTLVSLYGKCGTIAEAEHVFISMSQQDVVSWNAMLSAYVEQGQGQKALQFYGKMHAEFVSPDRHTLMFALQACATLADKEDAMFVEGRSIKVVSFEIGQALHTDACKMGCTSNILFDNTLVSMYGKCGAVKEAEDAFGLLPERSTVSWNVMLSAYVEQGEGEKALRSYRQMQEEGLHPDQRTFLIALQACGTLAENEEALAVSEVSTKMMSLEIGQALHADARRKGYTSGILVGTTLVSMYGKCGTIVKAENVFNTMFQRDVVSWTAMLSAYVEQGQGEAALLFYKQMQMAHVTLDDVTLICILQVSSERGSLEVCKELHFGIVFAGYDQNPSVAATLIHAYGSCASIIDSQAVFDEIRQARITSWCACIAGYSGEGDSVASLHMLEKLQMAGLEPNGVTFTSILTACSHTGLVVDGVGNFESMKRDHGLTPDLEHFGILIDLFGRAGDFKKVENMLARMPMQADLPIWLCLLSACRIHGNLELAKKAFDHAVNLQPKQDSAYILISNIYADAGLQA